MSPFREHHFWTLTGFKRGNLPFIYLGVHILKGRVNRIPFQALADKILAKLATWKGSSLSYTSRITLVSYVIHSMLYHLISVYSWHISLLKSI